VALLTALAVANRKAQRRVFSAADIEQALAGSDAHIETWEQLRTQDAIPMLRVIEHDNGLVDERLGVYEFLHLSLQEALAARAIVDDGAESLDAWRTTPRAFINDAWHANMLHVGGGTLGTALAKQRPVWDFGADDATQRVLWLLEGNTKLTALSLTRTSLDAEGCAALGAALASNTTLIELALFEDGIESTGAQSLGRALATNAGLHTVDLSGNRIDADGGVAVGAALAMNASLTQLNLGGNGIGTAGGVAIGHALATNATLTMLNLEYNGIGAEGGARIASGLASNTALKSLDLQYNTIATDGGVRMGEALMKNTTLISLSLQCNGIGADGGIKMAEALEKNRTLTTLDFGNNPIGVEVRATLQGVREARKETGTGLYF